MISKILSKHKNSLKKMLQGILSRKLWSARKRKKNTLQRETIIIIKLKIINVTRMKKNTIRWQFLLNEIFLIFHLGKTAVVTEPET